MAAREAARRPPPPPEEIRRQLGWRLEHDPDFRFLEFYLIPTACSHVAARLTLAWVAAMACHVQQSLLRN